MALAVLDLDFLDLPESLPGIEGRAGAVVLLRIAGRPCGQAILSSVPEEMARPLRERLLMAADSGFWEAWLRHRLGIAPQPIPPASANVTVLICTRDRTDDLRLCLERLMAMPDDGQSILVVDNAPATEATAELIAGFPTVRYLREPRPGLDVARNSGIRAATGEIVAMIDDDAVPDRLWLRTLVRNFDDPTVLAATGLTMALELETEAQIAFQRVGGFARGFKRVVYDAATCDPFKAWHAGAGVNMAMRRCVVEKVGRFDEALDAGTASLAGGDTDMMRRILSAGYRIVYDPEAVNWHRHRRTMPELERQIYGYEAAAFAILSKALLFERNASALMQMFSWLRWQVPAVIRSLRRPPKTASFNVALTQARGALAGPGRYLQARRRLSNGR